jgi:hypothetical protein
MSIGKLNGELARLTTAIAEGTGDSRTLAAAIRDREARRELLEAESRRLDAPAPPLSVTLDREVLAHLDEWRGLLGQNTAATRQLLRKALDGRVSFIPRGDASDRWYEMVGKGTFARTATVSQEDGLTLTAVTMSPTSPARHLNGDATACALAS